MYHLRGIVPLSSINPFLSHPEIDKERKKDLHAMKIVRRVPTGRLKMPFHLLQIHISISMQSFTSQAFLERKMNDEASKQGIIITLRLSHFRIKYREIRNYIFFSNTHSHFSFR